MKEEQCTCGVSKSDCEYFYSNLNHDLEDEYFRLFEGQDLVEIKKFTIKLMKSLIKL